MQVYLNAFRISDLSELYGWAEFAGQVSKPTKFTFHGRKRACCMDVDGDFVVGLLTTATQQSKDPLMVEEGGKFKIVIHDTSGQGERQALNFFVINRHTGVGLVARYQGAGSVVSFCRALKNRYRVTRRAYRTAYLAKLKEDGETFSKASILKRFAGKFLFKPVFREGTFEKLLKSLDVITELSYDEPTVKDPKYKLIKNQLKLDHRQLKFDTEPAAKGGPRRNSSREKIISFITEKILGRNVKVATAKGKDKTGKNLPPVTISPEVDSYGEYKYNDVVIAANLAIDDVKNLPMIGEMLAVARSNAIFTTPVEE